MCHALPDKPLKRLRSKPVLLPLVSALATACLCGAAAAQQPAGSVVVRDAATGELRAPTAAELRALRATPAPGTAQGGPQTLQQVVRPDGTRVLQLGDAGMVYSVATRGADGKLREHCVTGAQAAEQAVNTPAQSKEHDHEQR